MAIKRPICNYAGAKRELAADDRLPGQDQEIIKASTGSLTADEVCSTVINNYGQTAANTQTLPTAQAGMSFIAIAGTSGAGAFNIKPATGDKIRFDGTWLDDGDKVSCASPSQGDCIVFTSFTTGASSCDWIAETIRGTWTDGGA